MLSFAAPAAFLLAAIALPIIGFYILKVRLRRVPVSTNLFWNQIYEEKKPRSLWQQLRHLISLLVQLLVLAFLVLAIADPFLPWQHRQAKRVCLIIDNSASMSTIHGAQSRLELAKKKALAYLDSIRELDQVAILSANTTPEVLVGLTGHVPTLKQAVRDILPTDSATSLEAAIELGNRLVSDHPNATVLVLSDSAKILPPKPESSKDQTSESQVKAQLVWEPIGVATGNIGIVQFQVRRSLVDVVGYEVLASVTNRSESSVEARLELSLNDATVDILPLKIAPGETWTKSLEKTSIPGGVFKGVLTKIIAGDGSKQEVNGLTLDDQAFAILPSRIQQDILIVSPGNLFLRRAFEANPLANVEFTNSIPDPLPLNKILVFHKLVPPSLPPGDVVVIDPDSDSEDWKIQGEIADPIVTEQKEDSPLMRHIRMDNVIVPRAKKLSFSQPAQTLAGTISKDPIFAEVRRDKGRLLVLSVNLEESDLAFRTTFPILVTNSLQWFARQESNFEPAINTGSVHSFVMNRDELPASSEFQLKSPAGVVTQVKIPELERVKADESSEVRFSLGPFVNAGIWQLEAIPPQNLPQPQQSNASTNTRANDAGGSADKVSDSPNRTVEPISVRTIAANIANSTESDLQMSHLESVDGLGSDEVQIQMSSLGWFSRPLWFYLALLGAALSIAEWILYQRRVIS